SVLTRDERCVEVLLSNGWDINERGDCGRTALHEAAKEGMLTMIRLLLKHNPNIDALDNYEKTPLIYGSHFERPFIIQELLEANADINKVDSVGAGAIYYASYEGHVETVKMLL
ncbi:ankyrin, partial [Corynespora cassiicola Philippines]